MNSLESSNQNNASKKSSALKANIVQTAFALGVFSVISGDSSAAGDSHKTAHSPDPLETLIREKNTSPGALMQKSLNPDALESLIHLRLRMMGDYGILNKTFKTFLEIQRREVDAREKNPALESRRIKVLPFVPAKVGLSIFYNSGELLKKKTL